MHYASPAPLTSRSSVCSHENTTGPGRKAHEPKAPAQPQVQSDDQQGGSSSSGSEFQGSELQGSSEEEVDRICQGNGTAELLERRGSKLRGQLGMGVGSRKRRRSGSESEGGSDSEGEGSSECVADLDGDGVHIEGVVRGSDGGSEGGEGSDSGSFDSRDYDVWQKDGGGQGDAAESSGRMSVDGAKEHGDKKKGSREDGKGTTENGGKKGGVKDRKAVGEQPSAAAASGKNAAAENGSGGPKKRGKDIKALLKGKAKGNRLGQNARRALLEKMYGHNARHIRKGLVSCSRD